MASTTYQVEADVETVLGLDSLTRTPYYFCSVRSKGTRKLSHDGTCVVPLLVDGWPLGIIVVQFSGLGEVTE